MTTALTAETYSAPAQGSADTRARLPAGQIDSRFRHYQSRALLSLGPVTFALAVTAALAFGWINRNEGWITAESGVGYWLGIAGTALMLVLVLYPLRKRWRLLNRLGRIASWFRLHMVLGILGPLLIVFHANFHLGSLNSRAALLTMLIVVTSGIIGRYLHAKVHRGLYGQHVGLKELADDLAVLKGEIGADIGFDGSILADLENYLRQASAPALSLVLAMGRALAAGARARGVRRRTERQARALVDEAADRLGWRRSERRRRLAEFREHLDLYLAAGVKAERLALFERLLSAWHVLHMPLFILLGLTVTIHVVAVHLY